ncbi:MAG: ribokinase [Solirubrobacterales bacterium]|nr:ribokinase [Solirubrobacterales bacterium]
MAPRVAVVGHVEWVDFLVVPHVPGQGEILHVREAHEAAAGGGAMAARALHALAGRCTFFCAVGKDLRGQAAVADLQEAGIDVRTVVRRRKQRRAVTHLDDAAERTITVLGERLVPRGADDLPWGLLAEVDGVYFTGGDGLALRRARAARSVVATPRARDALLEAGVVVDAIVGSSSDQGEVVDEDLLACGRYLVQTEGARGGTWRGPDGTTGRWGAAPLPGEPVDAYGCGDSFAAAVAYGLGAGLGVQGACELAARVGAAVLCERAPSVGDLGALLTADRDRRNTE